DPQPLRHAAIGRLLDHYLHTGHAASRLTDPMRGLAPLEPLGAGVAPEPLADDERALAWLRAEHPVLVAAVVLAADNGFDAHTGQLAQVLVGFFDRFG